MPVQMGDFKPLNERFIEVISANGGKMMRPALDKFWVEMVDFLRYPPLPIKWDEATTAEWEEILIFIEEDLQWLLKLPHHKFWSQNVYDPTLQECLDSYLKNAPRYYDRGRQLPPVLVEKHKSIHRLVFMTFLRLSTHKESKETFITPTTFGELIYNHYIFDAVKLIELSVLYGGGNADLLAKMVENIFKQQPNYLTDLKMVVPTILEAFEQVLQKCGFGQDRHDTCPAELTERRKESVLMNKPLDDIHDIVSYIVDSALSLEALLDVYPPASFVLFDQGFIPKVSSFCEVLLPPLARTINDRQFEDVRKQQDLRKQLTLARVGFAKVCCMIIHTCCIRPVLECSGHEDEAVSYVERYLDTMSSLLSDKMFLAAVSEQCSMQENLELVLQSSQQVDEARTMFILDGVNAALQMYSRKIPLLTRVGKRSEEIGAAATNIQEDFQTDAYLEEHVAVMGAAAPRKTGVELDSLISEVKDLLPDLGEGFLEVCLEEYNYDTAKLINDILEEKLPPSLHELDRNFPRDTSSEMLSKAETEAVPSSLLMVRENIYDGDEFDVFSGQQVDTSKIHKGKKETKKLKEVEDKTEVQGLRSTYEDYYYEFDDEYDDEYDDTYDTHNVGAKDNDNADDLTRIRPFTTPRVLQRRGEPESEEDETSDGEEPLDRPQNRGLPPHRDEFVPPPPQVYARGRGGRGRGRGGPGRGGPGRGGGNPASRRGNERHKSSRANHNRKAQAAKKKGRGMIPS